MCLVKIVYDQSLHEWKVITLQLTNNNFDNNSKFLLNEGCHDLSLHSFPKFYKAILQSQKKHFSHKTYTPSCIKS